MNFLEMLSLIADSKEKILNDKVHTIMTNAHMYVRKPDGTWEQKELPPVIERFAPIPEPIKKDKKEKP